MHFEGQFTVPATAHAVLAAFEDVERMAHCMPGAAIAGQNPDGSYRGSMVVAFGPKKIRFDGRVTSAVDPLAGSGTLSVTGGAQLRTPAPAQVDVRYTVESEAGAAGPSCRVTMVSNAQLGGVLEDFARTGGVAVTDALMRLFAQRLAESLASSPTAAPHTPTPRVKVESEKTSVTAQREGAPALSATRLLWWMFSGRARAWWSGLRR